jgi:hypothetical protein
MSGMKPALWPLSMKVVSAKGCEPERGRVGNG